MSFTHLALRSIKGVTTFFGSLSGSSSVATLASLPSSDPSPEPNSLGCAMWRLADGRFNTAAGRFNALPSSVASASAAYVSIFLNILVVMYFLFFIIVIMF